jgi:peptidoglycan-N-acetylglucosamine deacetylase
VRAAGPALISSATGLLAAYAAPAVSVLPQGRLLFPAARRTGAKDAVALTFDDGPDLGLEAFLETLEGYGARATFFVVGKQVERDPGRLREILVRGHEVAVHCYRHRNHLRLSPRQTVEDMRRAKGIIEEASARTTRLFRPPHGVFNLASWIEAPRLGWKRVLWTRWGRDWEARATPGSIADRIGHPEAGDILLLHDSDRYAAPGSWRNTLGALPIVLERILVLGLRACPVGELLETRKCC